MADFKPVRVPDKLFSRDFEIEREYGITDLSLYGYWESETSLRIVGQIFSKKIKESFHLVCSIYDKDGDIIKTKENESYGSAGFVTSSIKDGSFFDGFPFRFVLYGVNKGQVKEIRIVLSS